MHNSSAVSVCDNAGLVYTTAAVAICITNQNTPVSYKETNPHLQPPDFANCQISYFSNGEPAEQVSLLRTYYPEPFVRLFRWEVKRANTVPCNTHLTPILIL
jgi:hypothetical protein